MSTQHSETVYVIVNKQAQRRTYHTERDCRYIRDATVRGVEKRLLHDDVTVCKVCSGTRSEGGRSGPVECPMCGEEVSTDLPDHFRSGCSGV